MMAIVCGGRDYSRSDRVAQVLDAAIDKLGLWCVIEGRCPTGGADRLAQEWAESKPGISLISVFPDDNWPSAGPRRNKVMFDILRGHDGDKGVIVFPGGKGTAGMLALAKSPDGVAAGIRVIEIDR